MTKIAIDPITRIEGHLRIEVEVDGGKVTKAWSSSTMFRGIEIIFRDGIHAMPGPSPSASAVFERLYTHSAPCELSKMP